MSVHIESNKDDIAETVLIPDATTWQGEKSIYLPYPSTDKQQNSNLTR